MVAVRAALFASRDGVIYASRTDRLPPAGAKVTILLKVVKGMNR
jgi:hypothetical protein